MNYKKLFFFFLTTVKRLPTPPSVFHFNTPTRFSSSFQSNNNNFNNIYMQQGISNITGLALDVNCRNGDSTKELSYKYPELQVYAMDKCDQNIKMAQKKYGHKFEFYHLNFEYHTGIRSRSFKVIQISNYDDIILSYQKAIILAEYGGLVIINTKSINDFILLQKYLRSHEKSLYSSAFYPNISHFTQGNRFYIFK